MFHYCLQKLRKILLKCLPQRCSWDVWFLWFLTITVNNSASRWVLVRFGNNITADQSLNSTKLCVITRLLIIYLWLLSFELLGKLCTTWAGKPTGTRWKKLSSVGKLCGEFHYLLAWSTEISSRNAWRLWWLFGCDIERRHSAKSEKGAWNEE